MHRRAFVAGVGAVLVAGCSASSPDTPDSPTASPTATHTIVADETLFGDTNYPVEIPAGAVLTVRVDVHRGGPVVVVVDHQGVEKLRQERVDTSASIDVEIESAGVYRIYVLNVDEAAVRVAYTE